jgi:hypothetical protein
VRERQLPQVANLSFGPITDGRSSRFGAAKVSVDTRGKSSSQHPIDFDRRFDALASREPVHPAAARKRAGAGMCATLLDVAKQSHAVCPMMEPGLRRLADAGHRHRP